MIPRFSSFELLRRLGSVPLEPLIDVLRDLHQRGIAESPQLHALLERGDISTVLPRRPMTPPGEAFAPPRDANYEAARKHFVEHAQRLREQAILAERLLDGFIDGQRTPATTLSPRELTIHCTRGGSASAWFVVVNSVDRQVAVSFRVGRIHGADENVPIPDLVSFDPPAPCVGPGQERVVRLSIDLEDHADLDTLEFGVDIAGDDRLLAKLWVRVQTSAQGGAQ